MSYTPTNWENGVTPVNADNLNKLEQGLAAASEKADTLEKENQQRASDIASLRSDVASDIASLRSDVASDIASVRNDLASGLEGVRNDIEKISDDVDSDIADIRYEVVSGLANLTQSKANAIIQKASGDSLYVEDTAETLIKLNSITAVEDRQDSTTGAQLFDASAVSDVTLSEYEVSGDGYKIVTKATTANTRAAIRMDELIGKSVTLKCDSVICSDSTLASTVARLRYVIDGVTTYASITPSKLSVDVTFPENTTSILLQIFGNSTTTDYEEALELEIYGLRVVYSENADLPWEKFTGRKASPCPGEAVVVSTNQLKLNRTSQTVNGVTSSPDTYNQMPYIYGEATADATFVIGTAKLEAGTYYGSCTPSSLLDDMNTAYEYVVRDANSNVIVTKSTDTSQSIEEEFTLTESQTVTVEFTVAQAEVIDCEFTVMIAAESGATWDKYAVEYTEGYPQEIEGTVVGKNLLDCSGLVEKTNNGVTFTPVYDTDGNLLYVNVNGTATAQTDYYLLASSGNYSAVDGLIDGERYILSGKANTNIRWRIANELGTVNENISTASHEFTYNGNMYILLRVAADSTFTNEKIYPMIRPASILDATYVPYGCMRVVGKGKNLLESCKTSTTSTSYGSLISNVRASLKEGVEYTMSVEITATAKAQLYWNNNSGVFSNKYFYVSAGTNRYSYTFTAKKDYEYTANVSWLSKNNTETSVAVTAANVQIELGNTATDYTPYTSQSILIDAPQQEFHAIGGVSDAITPEAFVKRFAEVVFDGSDDEGWVKGLTNSDEYARWWIQSFKYISKGKNSVNIANALCTHYSVVSASNTYNRIQGIAVGTDGLWIYDEECSTAKLTEWKAKLQANPITLVYELKEPEYTDLPTADQIALHSLKSYDGVTHLYTDTYPQMVIDAEFTLDTKRYIDRKFTELAVAIAATGSEV